MLTGGDHIASLANFFNLFLWKQKLENFECMSSLFNKTLGHQATQDLRTYKTRKEECFIRRWRVNIAINEQVTIKVVCGI